MTEMSFREKSAWISFLTLLVVFGIYFWNMRRVLEREIDYEDALPLSIGLLVAFVVLEIVLHVAVAVQSPTDARAPKDEREQLIDMKATRIAFQVFVVGALLCVGLTHLTRSAWAIGQHVLMAIVVAQLVRFGGQIVYFRRGC
jgi:hypothetical protein